MKTIKSNARKINISRISVLSGLLFGIISLSGHATTVTLINNDGAGEGFNDPTVVAPVTGNPGTTLGQQRLNVFQAAADHWESLVQSDVEIKVLAQMDPLLCIFNGGAVLGQAGPFSIARDFPNATLPGTWYAISLANSLRGLDIIPANPDIVATFNSDIGVNPICLGGTVSWWYGIGAPAPAGTIDLFSTVLHEISHGLNFLTLTGENGAELGGFPDIYEHFIEDELLGMRWPDMTQGQRALSNKATGDLVWAGDTVNGCLDVLTAGVSSGGKARLYAPNPYEPGSSVSHWDTVLTPDELMEPILTATHLQVLTNALFIDLGWTISGFSGCAPPVPELFYPAQVAISGFGYVGGGWRLDLHPRIMADVDGDGRSDIVGFANHGVIVALGQTDGSFSSLGIVQSGFGYISGGWRTERHLRFMEDVNGDNRADIVGFGDHGVFVALGQVDGSFDNLGIVQPGYGYTTGGWRIGQHPRMMADVNGDGRSDIVAFGNYGVFVALGQPDGSFDNQGIVLSGYGKIAGGWRTDQHLRMMADVNGDGQSDIVGFGNHGVFVALGQADGSFVDQGVVQTGYGYITGGWRLDQHLRMMADVNGDGRSDIVAFGNHGVFVALGQVDGSFIDQGMVMSGYGAIAGGWRLDQHPRVLADVNGDNRADIVGFGSQGVFVALGQADGSFVDQGMVLSGFGFANGWRTDQHPRFLTDITGDGLDDIVGFGNYSVIVSKAKPPAP